MEKEKLIDKLELDLAGLANRWRRTDVGGLKDEAAKAVQEYHEVMGQLWQLDWHGDDLMPDSELPDRLMPTYFLEYWAKKDEEYWAKKNKDTNS